MYLLVFHERVQCFCFIDIRVHFVFVVVVLIIVVIAIATVHLQYVELDRYKKWNSTTEHIDFQLSSRLASGWRLFLEHFAKILNL